MSCASLPVQMTDSGPLPAALLLGASFSSCRLHTVLASYGPGVAGPGVAGHGREMRGGCMAPPGGEEENGLWRKIQELSHFYLG